MEFIKFMLEYFVTLKKCGHVGPSSFFFLS